MKSVSRWFWTFLVIISIVLLLKFLGVRQSKIQISYLGQIPPGKKPELFLKDKVSTTDHIEFASAVEPGGTVIYFTRREKNTENNRLFYCKVIKGRLSDPEPVPFGYDCFESEPCFSPDGNRLYYGSKRPLPGSNKLSEYPYIWFVERMNNAWSEPKLLDSSIQQLLPMYVSFTDTGILYFTRNQKRGIYRAVPEKNDSFSVPGPLPKVISSIPQVGHPCISPDETFIIVDGYETDKKEGFTTLYISFRNTDDIWSQPINLRSYLGIKEGLGSARLSPDGQYLFFDKYTNNESDIYWMRADIIYEIKKIYYE